MHQSVTHLHAVKTKERKKHSRALQPYSERSLWPAPRASPGSDARAVTRLGNWIQTPMHMTVSSSLRLLLLPLSPDDLVLKEKKRN